MPSISPEVACLCGTQLAQQGVAFGYHLHYKECGFHPQENRLSTKSVDNLLWRVTSDDPALRQGNARFADDDVIEQPYIDQR